MFGLFRNMFPDKEESMDYINTKLWKMSFDNEWTWETIESDIYCSVPWTDNKPDYNSIEFINDKFNNINNYWDFCSKDLLSISKDSLGLDIELSIKKIFKIVSMSVNDLDNDSWEICFQSLSKFDYVYVCFQFQKDSIIWKDISR